MSNQPGERRGGGFFEDVVLSKSRQSSDVECPKCGHFFVVSRRNKAPSGSAKNKNKKQNQPASLRSLLLIGLAAVLIIVVSLWVYIASEPNSEGSSMPALSEKSEASPEKHADQKPDFQKASSTASVTQFLTEFFKARNWKERLPLVRQTPQLERRMERWYSWHKDGPIRRVAADSKATDIGGFIVVSLHGRGLPSDHIILEKTPSGYRVDWESFVVYQDEDWSSIQKEKPRGARMIRCKLEPIQNQHKKWTAEKGYRCYKLSHPQTGEVFFGYFNMRVTNMEDAGATALLKNPKGRFTLEVYYPQNTQTDQDVMISRVVTKGWVIR